MTRTKDTFVCDICHSEIPLMQRCRDESVFASGWIICNSCLSLLKARQVQKTREIELQPIQAYKEHRKPQMNREKLLSTSYQTYNQKPSIDYNGTVEWLKSLEHCEDWLVLDLESTGFDRNAEVIELVIADHAGAIILNTMVRAQTTISAMARVVHGIWDRDIKSAPTFMEIWPALLEVLEGRTVISYNVAFDLRILRQSAAAYGLILPDVQSYCLMYAYAYYCRLKRPTERYRTYSLEVACEQMGIQNWAVHRAQADTLAAFLLLQALITQCQKS